MNKRGNLYLNIYSVLIFQFLVERMQTTVQSITDLGAQVKLDKLKLKLICSSPPSPEEINIQIC